MPQIGPQGFLLPLDFQHHDDEQEQHHDGSGVNDQFQDRQEGRPQEIEEQGRPEKRQHQVNNGVHDVAARDGQRGGADNDGPQHVEHNGVDVHGMVLVSVWGQPPTPQGRLLLIFTGLASPMWVPLPPTISTPARR